MVPLINVWSTKSGGYQSCKTNWHRIGQFVKEIKKHGKTNLNKWKISGSMDCNTANTVYMIQCNKSKIDYIGETWKKLKDNFRNNWMIKNNRLQQAIISKKITSLLKHYNQTCLNIDKGITPLSFQLTIKI